MADQQRLPLPAPEVGGWPDMGDLSKEEILTFNNIKWHMSDMLITIRRSHENAEHDGREKERRQIVEYLNLVGYADVAADIEQLRHKKIEPKAKKDNA